MSLPFEICGFVGGMPMYRIHIKLDAWHRLVALSREGVEGLPDWLDYGNHTAIGCKTIATTDPDYFQPNKETPYAPNTGPDQSGFSKL